MIVPLFRQDVMNYKRLVWPIYLLLLDASYAEFKCYDGPRQLKELFSFRRGSDHNIIKFKVLPTVKNRRSVPEFAKVFGAEVGGFQDPFIELKVPLNFCRASFQEGFPLIDCFLKRGFSFKVFDKASNKFKSGVFEWGQFHFRLVSHYFTQIRSEDGSFKKKKNELHLFLSGTNKKRDFSRVDSLYLGEYCLR